MAKPLRYEPSAEDTDDKRHHEAYAELDAVIKMLHERGVFRLLYDMTGALPQMTWLLARELNSSVGRRRSSNLYALIQVLGNIPPDQRQRVLGALGEAATWIDRGAPVNGPYPPGLMGVRRLLHDEDLWNALGPTLEAMKTFAEHLQLSGADRSEDDEKTHGGSGQ